MHASDAKTSGCTWVPSQVPRYPLLGGQSAGRRGIQVLQNPPRKSRGYPSTRTPDFIVASQMLLQHRILTTCSRTLTTMASPIFSMRTLGTVRQSRFFSGTARRCAANVKSLGVVGAGQMVRVLSPTTTSETSKGDNKTRGRPLGGRRCGCYAPAMPRTQP